MNPLATETFPLKTGVADVRVGEVHKVDISETDPAKVDPAKVDLAKVNPAQKLLRVLLVEDSEDDAELVARTLLQVKTPSQSVETQRVDTYEGAREALLAYAWDLVLTDHAMPSFSSTGVLELLQELRLDLPCIVVSGAIGEEAAVALMRKGAADYVNKNKLARLNAAVTRALREAEARRARAEAEEALARERDFLRTVLDNITDGIVVSDEAGRIVMVNHAAGEFHSHLQSQFQSQLDDNKFHDNEVHNKVEGPASAAPADGTPYTLLASDGVTRLPQEDVPLYRALRGERVREAELIIAAEGAPRVLSANAQRLKDAAGRTVGAVMATHDVTARKEFEESIKRRAAQQEVVANLGQRAIAGTEPQALMGEAVVWVTRALGLPLGEVLEPSRAMHNQLEGGISAREAEGAEVIVRTRLGETGAGAGTGPENGSNASGYLVRRAGVGWGARGAEGTRTRERALETLRGAGRAEILKVLPAAARSRGAVGGIRAPIRSRGKTYGVLGVYDVQARIYRADEIAFVGTVADVLAEAIARKETEGALRARNERLALLSEMANQLLLANEPQKFVSSLFAKLSAHLGLEIYLNYLVDEDETGRQLRLASSEGVPEEMVKELEWLEPNEGVVGAVARSQRAVFIEDAQASQAPLPLLRSLGVRAYACLPLLAHGRLIGTLSFGTCGRTHFTADEMTVMEMACNQVAMALELARQTQNDELTGLPNRRALDRTLEREMALSRRHARPLGLLVLDLDHFKRVNDEHGHDAGDEVLRELSLVVRATIRSSDLLARWGGEEFVLVAPHADLSQLAELGERIRGAVAAHPFKTGPMTVSLGGADFSPRDNAKRLFTRADDALYEAKQTGRNRLVLKAAERVLSQNAALDRSSAP